MLKNTQVIVVFALTVAILTILVPNCGADNDTNAKRCVSCGTQLQQTNNITPEQTIADVCNRCGTVFPPSAKFCPKCGNKR